MNHIYEIQIEGPSLKRDRQDGALLRDLLALVVDGARRAARFAIEGRSSALGTPPAWVTRAAHFDVVADSRLDHLRFEAPTLGDALPEMFEQEALLPNEDAADPNRSALDYFSDGLEDAIAGRQDSDRYDDGLVKIYEKIGDLFSQGVTRVHWLNGHALDVEAKDVEQIGKLRRQTPKEQTARVAGTLNTIRHSDSKFELVQASGGTIRGVADDRAALKEHFGKPVVASGIVKFKPSGAVLRIEAASLTPATERELRVLGAAPRAWRTGVAGPAPRAPQGPRSGINALIGMWPGPETAAELNELIKALS
jgi:hypothetical protein